MQDAAARVDSVPPQTGQWKNWLSQGACEVFEMMIGVPLSECSDDQTYVPGEFTAVIGLAGAISGVFAIRCDHNTACEIASGMLGVDAHEARAEVWDALGEVCNMVAGNFKNKTGAEGEQSVLSVPTVIHGHDYRLRPLLEGSTVECLMHTGDGTLHLRLDYKLA